MTAWNEYAWRTCLKRWCPLAHGLEHFTGIERLLGRRFRLGNDLRQRTQLANVQLSAGSEDSLSPA